MLNAKEFLQSTLDIQSEKLGYTHFGITPLSETISYDFYIDWLKQNCHADMKYLETQKEIKRDARNLDSNLKTGLFFAFPYYPLSELQSEPELNQNFIAKYARGKDYHLWIIKHLETLIDCLSLEFPGEKFIAFTDSKPILERDYAFQAGLGWVGKNTCLIHPKHGSFFLIAEILTSLDLNENNINSISNTPIQSFCGTCTACLDACPTQALSEKKLDANLCISYWTIESKQVPPETIRKKFGTQFFGCDICQDVCPWNKKKFKQAFFSNAQIQDEKSLNTDFYFFRDILTSSHRQLQKKFAHTPLSRARGFGLKRNALIYIGNNNLQSLKPIVLDFRKSLSEEFNSEKDQQLIELANWCLSQLEIGLK